MNDATGSVNPSRPIKHLDTTIVRNHEQVVLIAGSNNISSKDSVQEIDDQYQRIIKQIKTVNPTCKLYIQELFPRHDMLRTKKISLVNSNLKQTCELMKVKMIPAPEFHRDDYTTKGLHLNEGGKAKLARSIMSYLDQNNLKLNDTVSHSDSFQANHNPIRE